MSALRNKDVCSGILFIAVGSFALAAGRDYEMGTAMQMRAGYLPAVLAMLLCGIGLILVLRGLLQRRPAILSPPRAVRSFLVVMAVVAFGLLIERAGLIASTMIMTGLAGLAEGDFRRPELAVVAVTLTAIAVAVFVWGLGLPLRLWPVALW